MIVLSLLLIAAYFDQIYRFLNTYIPADGESFYVGNCKIYNEELRVVRVLNDGGPICLPLPDGRWVQTGDEFLSLRAADGEYIWKNDGIYHHQIELFGTDKIVSLYADFKIVNGEKIKFDEVRILDLETGVILKKFSLYENFYLPQVKNFLNLGYRHFTIHKAKKIIEAGALRENSHLNSISFLGDKIIISDAGLLVMLFDKDLNFEKFLYFYRNYFTKDLGAVPKHDLQYLGSFFSFTVFKNMHYLNTPKNETFKIYEFKDGKVVFEFPIDPKDFVPTEIGGGVRKVGDKYLVALIKLSERDSVIGWVSKEGKWLVRHEINEPIQDLRPIPFKNFMRLNEMH